MKRREFLAGSIALAGCAGSPSSPNIAEPIPPVSMANNTLIASDNFASGSLAAGWGAWSGVTGQSAIVSHLAQPAAITNTYGQLWNTIGWGADQISEITIQTLGATGTNTINLAVRYQNPGGGNQGYQAIIANTTGAGTVQCFSFSAGVGTQLGATVTGLTIGTGDVWAICAAGACISIYQNGLRRFYIGDATTASGGAPGFAQSATLAAASCQISSWRGYNTVQQDGIWQKQGVIVAAKAAELTGTPAVGTGITGPEGMRYEGNAQILSGTVYKAYFTDPSGVLYAESLDGINWSFYSGNPVIAGYTACDVFKFGSTYYLWAQLNTVPGTGGAFMFTSANGVTGWSAAQATNLAPGAAAQWDNPTAYFGLHIADNIAGTFYGLYGALNGTGNAPSTGLATSPDGLTWTKSGSNPVLVGAFAGSQILKLGSTYYMWATQNQPGQGNASSPGFDPSESVRYQSSNLINWTNPTHSLHNTQMWESVNAKSGQCYVTAAVQLANRVALYHVGSPGDAIAPQVYQSGVALGPIGVSLASIVAGPEDGTGQVRGDNFSGGLGNWTTQSGFSPLAIVGGFSQPSATVTNCVMLFTAGTFKREQYSEITLHTLNEPLDSAYACPVVLGITGAQTGYFAILSGPLGTIQNSGLHSWILRKVAGVNTNLSPLIQFTPQVNDVIRLSVTVGSDGNNILKLFQNGFLIMQCEDYGVNLTTGFPGILQFATTATADSQIGLWGGGNANVIPSSSGGGGDLGPGYDFFYRF